MTIFLVERYLADIDQNELRTLPARLEAAAAQMRESGIEINYLDSTFLPEDEYCFCRFEAPSLHTTELVNRFAGAQYARISPTVILQPGDAIDGATCGSTGGRSGRRRRDPNQGA